MTDHDKGYFAVPQPVSVEQLEVFCDYLINCVPFGLQFAPRHYHQRSYQDALKLWGYLLTKGRK